MSVHKILNGLWFMVYGLFLFLLTICYLPSTTYAQTATQTATTSAIPYTLTSIPSSVSPTSPVFTDLLVSNIFHTFGCLAVGADLMGQPCLTYQMSQNAQGVIQGVPVLSQTNFSGGALGATTSIITTLYMSPPVRTSVYLASVGKDLGVVKEAHAQVVGSGAGVLDPVLGLWRVSRNISYLIMIVIFVVIGLMIMFRQRINPQTVITAQAALPGLVIGLILITFSYFIAALITDAAYVGVNLVGYYFSAAQPNSPPKLVQEIATENVGSIFSQFVGMISVGDLQGILQPIIDTLEPGVQTWVRLFGALLAFQTGSAVGGPLSAVAGSATCFLLPNAVAPGLGVTLGTIGAPICGAVAGAVGGTVVGTGLAAKAFADPAGTFNWALYFIAIAVMIYTMFKLLLRLVNNYLTIIFLTITAPFHFLVASLPGRQGIATNWILNMFCNVISFPAVFAVFYFVAYIWGGNSAPAHFFNVSSGQFNPTGGQTLPLFGGLDLSFVRVLIAYGALLATPTIPDLICKTIGRVGQAGQMIGQEISAGTRGGQGYFGQTTGGMSNVAGNINHLNEAWYGKPVGRGLGGLLQGTGAHVPGPLQEHTWPKV